MASAFLCVFVFGITKEIFLEWGFCQLFSLLILLNAVKKHLKRNILVRINIVLKKLTGSEKYWKKIIL